MQAQAVTLLHLVRLKPAWTVPTGRHHGVALSSRVRLARNLLRFPFPERAPARALAAVLQVSFDAARKTRALARAAYLQLDALEPVERALLAERHLASRALLQDPRHRGVVIGDREALSVMVNEEDHLRLQAVDSGLPARGLWTQVDELDSELSRALELAHHPEWGYLTACPTNTGTGLRVSSLLHLPALTLSGHINAVLEELPRLGLSARGLYGEGTRVLGDLYQISNAVTLGRAERDMLDAFAKGAEDLVLRELELQRSMAEGPNRLRLEDRVYRSLGALSQARVISFEEAMQHLSHLRLGLSLGWKLPLDFEKLNETLVLVQPAHLQMSAGKAVDAEQRDLLRAGLLRQRLRPA